MKDFRIAITGRPGVGKTTLVKRCADLLKEMGVRVAGFYTEEIRSKNGVREGFVVVDVLYQYTFELAKSMESFRYGQALGQALPRVGRYAVFVREFENYLEVLEREMQNADVTVIDEVGPMELLSHRFIQVMEKIIAKPRWIVTHHIKIKHPVIKKLEAHSTIRVKLTTTNRNIERERVLRLLREALKE